VNHSQSQYPFGAGAHGDPFISVGTGERQARTDVGEAPHAAVAVSTHSAKLAGVLDGREPGFEEVGPEGEDQFRLLEIIEGNGGDAEGQAIRLTERFVADRLVAEPGPAPHGPEPIVDQTIEASRDERGHQGDATSPSLEFCQPGGENLLPFLPRGRAPRAVRPLPQGLSDPVRVVEPLEARLTTGAEAAAVDRMIGVPLDLDGAPLHGLHQHPAAGGTFPADGGVPGGLARDDLLRGNDIRNQTLGGLRPTARHRGRRPTDPDDLEEVSPIHFHNSSFGTLER